MDKIQNPQVPVFIAKSDLKELNEYIPINDTFVNYVSYKDKSKEVISLLFEPKTQRYKDEYGQWIERLKYPELPYRAETLHPRLFFYDVPIEQMTYMEYCMNRYVMHGDVFYEEIPMPDLKFAAFDIETCKTEYGEWYINTNTFVDETTKTAYIDVLKSDIFKRQDEMIKDPQKFYQDVKDALIEMIDNCSLKGKSKATVQEYCYKFVDELDIKLRTFDTESELITETTKLMFTTYKPDILMAFNTTYDVGMFQQRIDKLNLPVGTFNERGIGYENTIPPFMKGVDENYAFRKDTLDPTKREVYLNNISHTIVADYQTCYFSNRLGTIFDNYKLMGVAERVLGFGKYDYTFITQDITKLAETDFYFHSIYAIIDSILLIMCNHITKDFESKIAYQLSTKVNIEATSVPSTAIPRGTHTDAIVQGFIPGNNVNKVLGYMGRDEVLFMSKLLGVNYIPLWQSLLTKQEYGGGIVASTNLYNFNFKSDIYKAHSYFGEANLTLLRRMESLSYNDLKSHYPTTMVTRNLSKGTLYGNIISITVNDKVILTQDPSVPNHLPNLGTVNLSIIDSDIISYGAVCNSLPTLTDLVKHFVSLDSEPKFKPVAKSKGILDIKGLSSRCVDLIKILTQCNSQKFRTAEEDFVSFDNKWLLINDGEIWYNGMLVKFSYPNNTILQEILRDLPFSDMTGIDINIPLYAKKEKDTLIVDNNMLNELKSKAFDYNEGGWSGWLKVPDKEWDNINELSQIFTYRLNLEDDIKIDVNHNVFYYPWVQYSKNGKSKINIPVPNYRYKKLDKTTKIVFQYSILIEDKHGDSCVNIEQHMQITNI